MFVSMFFAVCNCPQNLAVRSMYCDLDSTVGDTLQSPNYQVHSACVMDYFKAASRIETCSIHTFFVILVVWDYASLALMAYNLITVSRKFQITIEYWSEPLMCCFDDWKSLKSCCLTLSLDSLTVMWNYVHSALVWIVFPPVLLL